MRAAIYCRISSDREGAGLGVATQEADCRALCADRGWDVTTVHTDNDISAYSGRPRPGYRQLLDDVKAGELDVVVAWHTDRLHRNPVELEAYVSACEQHGVATHTVKAGHIDLSTPSGRMIARMLGAQARYEVEHSIERMRRAKQRSAEAGLWRGGPRPYGYEADGRTVRHDEARHVLEASEGVLAGRSIRGLVAEWNTLGIRTVRGADWRGTGLRHILLRARNAGLIEHHGKIIGPAEWPAIVPEGIWRGVAALLRDPSRVTTTHPVRRWLGTGLYRCGQCGGTLIVGQSNTLPTYRCGPSGCRALSRTAAPVDAYVTVAVVARLRRRDFARILDRNGDRGGAQLEADAAALRARLDEIASLYAAGTVDATQLAVGSRQLRERLEAVETKLAGLAAGTSLARVMSAEDPGLAWMVSDQDQRRAILDELLTVTVLPSGRGRPAGWEPGQPYFRPESVLVDFR